MDLDEDLDLDSEEGLSKLNDELKPVFRLTVILSGGCPGGRPPWAKDHTEPLNLWIQKVCSMSTAECYQLANAGDPEMIHDFALRAAAGIELPSPNSLLAERYWNLLLRNPKSTMYHLGLAHAQLILFTGVVTEEGSAGPSSRMDDFIRAGTHAEAAAQAGHGRAPNVLKLGKIFQAYRYGEHKEVFGQWTRFWAAVDGWVAEKQAALDKDSAKRVERPSRYKCAAPECRLEASTGKLLRACAFPSSPISSSIITTKTAIWYPGGGKCEDAYKPRYCTKECQVADWKNHKPLCKPGLQAANTEPSRSTPSATDPSIRIHRHDVALGGGQGIVVTPRSPTTKSGGGQYTVNIGGVKLHSENEALSAQQLKDLAATIKSGSNKGEGKGNDRDPQFTAILYSNKRLSVRRGVLNAFPDTPKMKPILAPFQAVNLTEGLVFTIIDVWMPWIAEAILLVRIAIVFPRSQLPMLLASPAAVKIGRAAISIVFTVRWIKLTLAGISSQSAVIEDLGRALFKAAFFLELFDNAYYVNRITTIYMSVPNLIFGLVRIITTFVATNATLYAVIYAVNAYVAIISTVFATIWSSTTSLKEAIQGDSDSIVSSRPVVFHMNETIDTTASAPQPLPLDAENSSGHEKTETWGKD
ncbi:hypothetical protein GGX14DRAFT_558238 [Mycena pura]|uniref:MYND-type domain-containing protein n=1 Tax=Mycena pura TaxID=153505 RepID=A0AAD6YHK9_9AGAR|nr:hypothetical protein GGX14DRAFT_558238 [Mycena pura]